MAFCTECGSNVSDETKFCPSCGKAINKDVSIQQQPQVQPEQTKPEEPVNAPVLQISQPSVIHTYSGMDTAPPKGSRYAVMGTFGYIGTFILFMIPILGLIFSIAWSFSGTVNLNRRNLSRTYLIFTVIAVILCIISLILFSNVLSNLLENLRNYFQEAVNTQFSDIQITDTQSGGLKNILDELTDGLNSLPVNRNFIFI